MHVDVLIVGGGLVGNALAIALKDTGLSLALVEAKPISVRMDEGFDARSIALSLSSKKILDGLQLWSYLKPYASAIKHIDVSRKGCFNKTRLNAEKESLDAFGYVVEVQHLNQQFQKALSRQTNLHYLCPASIVNIALEDDHAKVVIDRGGDKQTITASVIVAADGVQSKTRSLLSLTATTINYDQVAVVANIGLKRSHGEKAFERFTDNGLIALLPMLTNRMALVWALPVDKAKDALVLSDDEFLKEIQSAFGYRLGCFMQVGRRGSFPLSLLKMDNIVNDRVVFIGNAAHGLHPIAGQGLNLGLRDVAMLAELLASQTADVDARTLLHDYQQKRRDDISNTTWFTHGLVRLFSEPRFQWLKSLSLLSFDSIPLFKHELVQHAMGYGGKSSRLASGLPL